LDAVACPGSADAARIVLSINTDRAGSLFVLTLADASERQARVRGWLAKSGLPCDVFVEGVDLRGADASFQAPVEGQIARWCRYGVNELSSPEYGCLLGHQRIWRKLTRVSSDWALVVEDDAVPCHDDWFPAMHQMVSAIECSRLRGSSWLLHLSRTPHSQCTMALRPIRWGNREYQRAPVGLVDPRLGDVWTTLAYVISRQAAQRLLERESALPFLADDWSQRLREQTLEVMLAAEPPLFAGFEDFPSQIQQRVGVVEGPPLRRLRRKMRTVAYRLGWGGCRL
jgi:GR25 family glycosyltransferase involved in LPS biosynthesis